MTDITDTAYQFHAKLKKLLVNKAESWPVYDTLNKRLGDFKATMVLLPDLRHESIRERHWQILRLEVKEEFNERSDEFTLEEVFKLGFLDFEDTIVNIADEAKKQMKVEKDLFDIENTWKNDPQSDLHIKKEPSKADEDFYKIGSTDNIMTLIEDHTAILATHKASPFYKNFDVEIDLWEDNIAKMNETLDLLITATSKWQYLESIFCGQPDIIRMLGEENAKFQTSNKIFRAQMIRINKEKNCYRALITGVSNFIKTLQDMVGNFEMIQKSLIQFLDSKRGKFPRFYFLPNEDLLEIIGMGKNPAPLNKHINKIFNGVNALEAEPAPKGSSAKYYIKALLAENAEESIELDAGATDGKKLEVDQNVEEWLGNKESGLIVRMREAL
jgi:dynein heavy chain